MFEKSKIKKILGGYPQAERQERAEMINRLRTFGDLPVEMLAEALRTNRIFFADAREIARGVFTMERLDVCVQQLADPKENLRQLFVDAMKTASKSALVPKLIEHLSDDDPTIRKSISTLLVEYSDASIAPKIAPLLKSDSKDLKKIAMDILGGVKADAATTAMIPLLKDGDSWIRRKAAEALCKLDNKEILPPLIEAIQENNDPSMTKTVLGAVGRLGGAGEGVALLSFLKSREMVTRNAAADALCQVADSTLVPKLIELMAEKDVNVRRSAVDVLNGIKDPRTAGALVRALKDGDWWVRETATDALSELGGSQIGSLIIELLDDTDENVRRAAVEFFCRVTSVEAYPRLVKLLEDDDWWVREKAVVALGRIGDPKAIPAVMTLVEDSEVRWAIPKALAAIGGDEILEPLSRFIDDGQKQMRHETLRAYALIFTQEIVPYVKRFGNDEDPTIQEEALTTLKDLTGRHWLPEDCAEERRADGAQKEETLPSVVSPGDIQSEGILVIDLCNSTDIAAARGDSVTYQMMTDVGEMALPIARENGLAFYKSTGDGYLMTFGTVERAFAVARQILCALEKINRERPGADIALRFAVNAGETRVSLDGDRVGIAVNMAFRVEGIQGTGEPVTASGELPTTPPKENRILLTEVAHNELFGNDDYRAKLAGYFKLKGINGIHPIYCFEG